MGDDELQLFENKAIRTAWDEETEEWYHMNMEVSEAAMVGNQMMRI